MDFIYGLHALVEKFSYQMCTSRQQYDLLDLKITWTRDTQSDVILMEKKH